MPHDTLDLILASFQILMMNALFHYQRISKDAFVCLKVEEEKVAILGFDLLQQLML